MFCPKCGTENDKDANYCEGCGQSLQNGINKRDIINKRETKNNGISTGVKALIVICIILIAGIGVTAGMLLQKPSGSAPAPQINSTNNSNLSTNTINNATTKTKVNTTTKKQKSEYISPSQAMAIANKYAAQYGTEAAGLTYIDFIDGKGKYYGADGDSYYHVDLKWKPGHSQPYDAGYVEIDAINGAVNPRG